MKKTFVLDTNVLLHDPNSPFSFADNDVVIPIAVIEEIDRFKKEMTEVGRNARAVSRTLDRLREQGHLTDGVPTSGGGTLRIHLGVPIPRDFPFMDGRDGADMRILALAWELSRSHPPVQFITKDTNLRLKADAVGVHAEDYVERSIVPDPEWLGWREAAVPREVLDRLFSDKTLARGRTGDRRPGPQRRAAAARPGRPAAHRAGPAPAAPAGRGADRPPQVGLGDQAAQRRAEVRARSAARPRGLSGHAGRQGRDRQDPAGPGRGPDADGREAALPPAGGRPPDLPDGARSRLPAGRPRREARPWMQPICDNLEFLLGEFDARAGRTATRSSS